MPSFSHTTLSHDTSANQLNPLFLDPSESFSKEVLFMQQIFNENQNEQSLVNVEDSKNYSEMSSTSYLDFGETNVDDVNYLAYDLYLSQLLNL